MMDSSEGTIDFRYQEREDQDNGLILEQIKKEKRLLQENLNKYIIIAKFSLFKTTI